MAINFSLSFNLSFLFILHDTFNISTFLQMYLALIVFYPYVFANITFISLLVK